MNATDDLERQLRSMLAAAAPRQAPRSMYGAVMTSTQAVRQRPAMVATLRSTWFGVTARSSARLGPALVLVLLAAALFAALALVGSRSLPSPAPTPVTVASLGFVQAGSMTSKRADAAAVRLADGRVLIVGGWDLDPPDQSGLEGLVTAEIYDPATRAFTPTGSMLEGRVSPSATLLADGRVLVAGGYPAQSMNVGPPIPRRSAELYDPIAGTFSPTGSMAEPRAKHTALRLSSGEVLMVGGDGGIRAISQTEFTGITPKTVERYDPATESFRNDPAATVIGRQADPVVLSDGRVFSVGFDGPSLYDPGSGTSLPVSGAGIDVAFATVLGDGRILLGDGGEGLKLYDPSSGGFGPLVGTAGSIIRAVEMGDGRLLLLGSTAVPTGEPDTSVMVLTFGSFDPATGTIDTITPMPGAPVDSFTATALADGSVLVAGGANMSATGSTSPLATAYTYGPE